MQGAGRQGWRRICHAPLLRPYHAPGRAKHACLTRGPLVACPQASSAA